jgi:hypothetical protein
MLYGLSRRSRCALLIGVAGACLTLCACGGGGTTASSGAKTAAADSAHFCSSVISVMRIGSNRSWQSNSASTARAQLKEVLTQEAKGFTALEPEAPAQLRGVVRTIVDVYRSDERVVATSSSMGQVNRALVKANDDGRGGAATRELLSYVTMHCRAR